MAAAGLLALHLRAADLPAPARRDPLVIRRNLLPFAGRITAIDRQAGNITVGERVFQIPRKSKIAGENQGIILDDVKIGDTVQGKYGNTPDGKLVAELVRFSTKSPRTVAKTKRGAKPV